MKVLDHAEPVLDYSFAISLYYYLVPRGSATYYPPSSSCVQPLAFHIIPMPPSHIPLRHQVNFSSFPVALHIPMIRPAESLRKVSSFFCKYIHFIV